MRFAKPAVHFGRETTEHSPLVETRKHIGVGSPSSVSCGLWVGFSSMLPFAYFFALGLVGPTFKHSLDPKDHEYMNVSKDSHCILQVRSGSIILPSYDHHLCFYINYIILHIYLIIIYIYNNIDRARTITKQLLVVLFASKTYSCVGAVASLGRP